MYLRPQYRQIFFLCPAFLLLSDGFRHPRPDQRLVRNVLFRAISLAASIWDARRCRVTRMLPRLLAGERVTCEDIIALAHGGLCRACPECHYPCCSFGRAAVGEGSEISCPSTTSKLALLRCFSQQPGGFLGGNSPFFQYA